MVEVVGIDHTCIGTDTKLTKPYRGKDNQNKFQERPSERTNLAWNNQKDGFYYEVENALLKEGFSASEIRKIAGENSLRIFKMATSNK